MFLLSSFRPRSLRLRVSEILFSSCQWPSFITTQTNTYTYIYIYFSHDRQGLSFVSKCYLVSSRDHAKALSLSLFLLADIPCYLTLLISLLLQSKRRKSCATIGFPLHYLVNLARSASVSNGSWPSNIDTFTKSTTARSPHRPLNP